MPYLLKRLYIKEVSVQLMAKEHRDNLKATFLNQKRTIQKFWFDNVILFFLIKVQINHSSKSSLEFLNILENANFISCITI